MSSRLEARGPQLFFFPGGTARSGYNCCSVQLRSEVRQVVIVAMSRVVMHPTIFRTRLSCARLPGSGDSPGSYGVKAGNSARRDAKPVRTHTHTHGLTRARTDTRTHIQCRYASINLLGYVTLRRGRSKKLCPPGQNVTSPPDIFCRRKGFPSRAIPFTAPSTARH